MKKKFRAALGIAGVFAAVLIIFVLIPASAMENDRETIGIIEDENVIAKGNLTETVTWAVTEDDLGEHTLIIDGTGPMSDFTASFQQPWKEWNNTIYTLVIRDGVTRIGNNTMGGMNFKEVKIGKGVEAIGQYAFAYGRNLEHITIPGNVKRIEANAFVFHYSLYSVTFEEGVEEIGHSAFGGQAAKGSVFHIPASVIKIADLACWTVTGYTVAEGNPYYSAVDGVLYDKTGSVLVDYPKYRASAEYYIPDSVCEIGQNALQRIAALKKIYIPSSVQKMQSSYLMRWSSVEEVYVDDGVPFQGDASFYACSKLTVVRLPENMGIQTLRDTFAGGCNLLEQLKIPNGVSKIESLGWPTKALQKIIYDAGNAQIKDQQIIDGEIRYELIIGENVDYLPTEFQRFASQAEQIKFQGVNQFTIEEGAFNGAGEPLESLAGTIYVDEQGVVYQYDAEQQEAWIVYSQEGFQNLQIPASIQPEEALHCRITGIRKDAFRHAANVKTITFENPEQIRFIEAYAFANCTSLTEVNGFPEIEAVIGTFTGLESAVGYRAFYNTGLMEGDAVDLVEDMEYYQNLSVSGGAVSDLAVTVNSGGGTMKWIENTDGQTGYYSLLTGDTLTISVNVGNKEGEDSPRCRIYFQKSRDECTMSVKSGETYLFDEQEIVCYSTEDPNCIYAEFVPLTGRTISIPITAVYPSPSSAGGSLIIWSVILEEDEADKSREQLVLSSAGGIRASWGTVKEEYGITKTSSGNAQLSLCGTEEGNIIPSGNLEWQIVLQRKEELSLSYGRDNVKSVSYQDKMVLPEGISWQQDIIDIVKEGGMRRSGNYWYAGEKRVCYLGLSGGQLNLSAVRFTWDEEEETIILSYNVTNTVVSAQMNTNTISYIVYAEAMTAVTELFDENEENQIRNEIEAAVQYSHSEKAVVSSDAYKTIKVNAGSVKVTNKTVQKPNYFGESVTYEIAVNNPGAITYQAEKEGSWVLQDVLSPYTLLAPDDIEKMFAEDQSKSLSITIEKAEFKEWEQCKGIYEGTVAWRNGYNSGENLLETADGKIVISWNSSGTGIQVVKEGSIYEEDSLEETFKQAGYSAGRWAEYTVSWTLNSEDTAFALKPGETRKYQVYATAKDTFQMLSEDWPDSYPTDAKLSLTNTARLLSKEGAVKASAGVWDTVKREAYIEKTAFVDGNALKDGFSVDSGEHINYTLKFTHYGKGMYQNLPIVDEMFGAQALLVPVDLNGHLSDLQLEIYEMEEDDYYILTEGSYSEVRIGGEEENQIFVASSVTVEKKEENTAVWDGEENHEYIGLHTRIEWNCAELPAGNYKLYLNYDGIVMQEFANENIFTVGTKVWVNDRINSRIYASLWGGGTIIDFDKEILTKKGKTWEDDGIDEDGYSLVSAGEQVTYRMTLKSKGVGTYVVSGEEIADQLPANGGVFRWTKDVNVDFYWDSTHTSTKVENLDAWTIEDSWNGEEKEGIQYILWPDNARITFSENDARVFLYVTLTYPHMNEQSDSWEEYCQAVKGDILVNTFYVHQFPVNVTHHLREAGQVLLQKGVYGTSYKNENQYIETQSRLYYNNKDSRDRQVIYYLVLYNGGTKYWYLNDIYDDLPAGFTFEGLISDSSLEMTGDGDYVQTLSEFDENNLIEVVWNDQASETIVYKSAFVRRKETEGNQICFQISGNQSASSISYDEERSQYYLRQNEAIVFGYICDTGKSQGSEDYAVNRAFMCYEDYPCTGVNLVSESQTGFSGVLTDLYGEQNDGTCALILQDTIEEQYEIKQESGNALWLMSEVCVSRGQVIPGVTKFTDSYTVSGSGQVIEYRNRVSPNDIITWRVRLSNSGSLSITDYTLKDYMPAPYVFCGNVSYTIYDYQGREMKSYQLFTFSERSDDTITISNNNSKISVSNQGETATIKIAENGTGSFAMEQTAEGTEILTIHFADYNVSIPEGGYMDIQLSSYNPTNHYNNTVYTNQAELILNSQEFSSAAQGSMIKTQEGVPYAVKNSSPVTVAFGYGTGSEKAVKEKTGGDKYAVSTDFQSNYITLSSEEEIFTYLLTVTNETEKSMEKLVLIDRLPEKGDTSPFDTEAARNSEFAVGLAEESNFKVEILHTDGTLSVLKEEDFTVNYSESTVFSEEDWNGTSNWEVSREDARAVRIVIGDAEKDLIPAGAKVTVSFDCVKKGETEPGQTAWNNFGYHYKLKEVEQELEAMPLAVGVKIAEVPVLEKKLVDTSGIPVEAEENVDFSFVIYEGLPLQTTYAHMEELLYELEAEKIPYMIERVTVESGQTQSEQVGLQGLYWKENSKYTITEFITDSRYQFRSFNGLKKENLTFEYKTDQKIVLSCVNTYLEWNLEIIKMDSQDSTQYLKDAVFALYAMDEAEKMEQLDESVQYTAEDIIETENIIWYLADVQRTDDQGRIRWNGLRGEKYYLLEIQAPNGYNLNANGRIAYQRDADSGHSTIIIENEKGTSFPITGGAGTAAYMLTGISLALSACCMSGIRKQKTNKKGKKNNETNEKGN